jgi:aerobic carbon-monoxide dehydrogenase medium subunit
MKAPPFAYARARTLDDAFALLADPDATAIAGGQSLLASLAFRLSQPSLLVDIGRIAELSGVTLKADRLRIGAVTTHTALSRSEPVRMHAPLLADAAKLIAHPAIRNRGTIGGSLAYADPAAELPACVVALDATIVVGSTKGERRVAAADFFTGLLSTALADGELIKAIEVPLQAEADRTVIEEIARRSGDYAMAGVAVKLSCERSRTRAARVVMFGVGEGPVLAAKVAAALVGQDLSTAAIAAAQSALDGDIDPPEDQHGGPEMKRQLARVVLGRALTKIMTGPRS